MVIIKSILIILLGLLFALGPGFTVRAAGPTQVVLTWQSDPHTTMTITFRTDTPESGWLYYTDDFDAPLEGWEKVTTQPFSFEETSAWIHTAELTELEPGQLYKTVLESNGTQASPFFFQTAPKETEQISFLAGGDSRTNREDRRMVNKLAALEKPDFVLFGGDFIENPLSEDEWDDWFDDWHEIMITDQGRRIPIIPVIGNHEVQSSYNKDKEDAPFYYNRFFLPENEKYYALEYGPLVLINLDSGHTAPVLGEQTAWLKKTLEQYKDKKWIIVQYHIPAFSSSREFGIRASDLSVGIAEDIRRNWVPLFEQYKVAVVHENHDHAYKITHPLAGVGELYTRLEAMIDEAITQATEDYDPGVSYSPWTNPKLQHLSRGDWQGAGYAGFVEGLKALFYYQALYAKQSGNLTPENIYRSFGETVVFQEFWQSIGFEEGFDFLIDHESGVYYVGDGGWGAPLRGVKNPADYWWLDEASTHYNFFRITLNEGHRQLHVDPIIIDGQGKSFTLTR